MKMLNFDMDGTLANLYGEPGWLSDLQSERTDPYENAKPLLNLSLLARYLNKLQKAGYQLQIISWTSKSGSSEFQERIVKAKEQWLHRHLASVHWDGVKIVAYGTPKSSCGYGILFDDEERNRVDWNGTAYDETEIITILKGL